MNETIAIIIVSVSYLAVFMLGSIVGYILCNRRTINANRTRDADIESFESRAEDAFRGIEETIGQIRSQKLQAEDSNVNYISD